jgi:hypothetical protein
MEELAGAAAQSGRLGIAPERWDYRRNRVSTDQRKEEKAMIERFDHRPMLTALLALSTTVLVVVVTLATLLITAPPAATPSSVSDGGNAGAAPTNHLPHRPNMTAGGESYGWSNKTRGGSYRWNIQSQDQQPGVHDKAGERHAKPVSD